MASDIKRLDEAFHFIMEVFVSRGFGPHYTELAKRFGFSPDDGRALLHEVIDTKVMPMWLYPGTDLIVSFAPFNNLPNPYAITVDGQQKWFGQWGFEALAVCWVFRGKAIQIDAPCLDCGESMRVVVRDGMIENQDPDGICGYVSIPLNRWAENWPDT